MGPLYWWLFDVYQVVFMEVKLAVIIVLDS
jgi:hypothetical protein